jgi:hypothetical protein
MNLIVIISIGNEAKKTLIHGNFGVKIRNQNIKEISFWGVLSNMVLLVIQMPNHVSTGFPFIEIK